MTTGRSISMELIAIAVTTACAIVCAVVLGPWRGLFVGINIVAFGYYGLDKYRAGHGGQRVPEVVLLGFAAGGGVPGSLLGQCVFNHKTSKSRFKRVFWTIAILQAAVLTGLMVHGSWS